MPFLLLGPHADPADPFHPVEDNWEVFWQQFLACMTPGWLLCLDESIMEKWKGRGMPGFMVVPRKPTPMGLDMHTVCDALSGILVG